MPLEPVEFTLGDHTFRHTPLAPMRLADEHYKLLVRFDHESGALNSLAFTFTQDDFDAMKERGAAGLLRLVKLLSMLLRTDEPLPSGADEDALTADQGAADEGEDTAPRDLLPRTLRGIYVYYAKLGQVEVKVGAGDGSMWVPIKSAEDFDRIGSPLAPPWCTFNVLRGLFVPFVEALRALSPSDEVKDSTEPS